MSFKKILGDLTHSCNAIGSILLDHDGEFVDLYIDNPEIQLKEIGAHKGVILSLIKDAERTREEGNVVQTIGISTDTHRLALTALKENYYVLVLMLKTSHLGKAEFQSKKYAHDLEHEMGI